MHVQYEDDSESTTDEEKHTIQISLKFDVCWSLKREGIEFGIS